jgi:hypothetical protein
MLATLLFDPPVDRVAAERALIAFVGASRGVLGRAPDEAGLHVDMLDGIHCHLLWAGLGAPGPLQDELAGLWPYGYRMFTHTHGLSSEEAAGWDRMTGGRGSSWESLGSR